MPPRGKLKEYDAKRDFGATPEPSSTARKKPRRKPKSDHPRFVVHEHHARRLHWDLRLERDGVLLSWAIPNGIPEDPEHNRKAIHVEDHPLDYIDFEGEIPAGSYGAGEVQIWDHGTYELEKYEDRKLVVVFQGARLQGRYSLFQTRGKDWMIHRMDPAAEERDAIPDHVLPMLATPGRLPREDGGWAYEVKWDGVRAILHWQPGRLRIESRNLNEVTVHYPELRAIGLELGSHEAILDGEIVAFDERGRPSFGILQHRIHQSSESAIRRLAESTPVTYVIFDLLHLDGYDLVDLPYRERRALLDGLKLQGPHWQTPAYHEGEGSELLRVSAEHELEGIVAKRLDSPYRPGRRTEEWLKIKNVLRQEFVIGGWLPGKGRRAGSFGALLLGYYESLAAGELSLRFAGRVGTGFDEGELERLAGELELRARSDSPFDGSPPIPREAHFVDPELVAEIEFSAWTRDRILRHSSYKGLREDKPAQEVRLEAPVPAAESESELAGQGVEAGPAKPARPRRRRAEQGPADAQAGGLPYRIVRETKRAVEVEVEGRTLKLSNRDKVLYPKTGFTKGELVDYYAAIAPVVLPHLAGRPLTLKRYPDGVEGEYFYEKRCPTHRPDWVQTAPIWSGRKEETIDYCLAEDLPTLMWAANLADIELHTSLSRARDIDTPTSLVFDLDPGPPAGLRQCSRVALLIRELFEAFELETFAKTSGSKGIQVYVPLNTPTSYEQTKPFARAVAELLERNNPRLVVSRMSRELRPGRVLIDWSQNDPHKTTVNVYSMRARERPTISTPLLWEEVQRAARTRGQPELSFEPPALLERIERHGDLFGPLLSLAQELPDLSAKAGSRGRSR